MNQSDPSTSLFVHEKLTNPHSQKVPHKRRFCSLNYCGLSLVLLLVTGTSIFLYVTNNFLLSKYWNPVWWKQNSSNSSRNPVFTPSNFTEVPWEPPGPYYVAYPHKYIFTLDEPDACKVHNPFLVLMVPVAAKDRAARYAIRVTWGNESMVLGRVVRLFFLLGLPSGEESEQVQAGVQLEKEEHHDLLQSNFLDSYRNLTIKSMMMMEWIASRCQNTDYAMKIDSDMFLNVHNLVKMLLDSKTPKQNYITGLVARYNEALRDTNSKWYMPEDMYPYPVYPPYVLGFGYVFSADLPKKIVNASKHIKSVYIEDVHIGLCLKHLGIQPTDPPSGSLFLAYMQGTFNRCHFASVITTILYSPAQLIQYWVDLNKPEPPC